MKVKSILMILSALAVPVQVKSSLWNDEEPLLPCSPNLLPDTGGSEDVPKPDRLLEATPKKRDQEPCFIDNEKDVPNDLRELVEAIENNDAIRFTSLMGEVNNLNLVLPDGKAPIHYAVENNNEFFVTMLCAAGADCDLRSRTQEEVGNTSIPNPTPIEIAVIFRLEGMFNLLLKEVGVRPRPNQNNTLLHYIAKLGGTNGMIKSLVQGGLPIDSRGDYSRTALHVAALYKTPEVAKELLILGAEIEMKENYGRTPLHLAISLKSWEVAKELLEYGAKTDVKDNRGKTPLHYAEMHDSLEGVKELLKYGAKTDIKDNVGKTPLHYAVNVGYSDVVKELLTHGADANIKDNVVGDTPLFYAVQNGSLDVVKELLKYGAKVDIKNNKGKNPLYYAKNEEMKVLLRNGQKQQSIRDTENDILRGLAEGSLGTLAVILLVNSLAFAYRKVRKSQNQLNVDQSEQETIEFELPEIKKRSSEEHDHVPDLGALAIVDDRLENELEKERLLSASSLEQTKNDAVVPFRRTSFSKVI